MSRIFVSGSNLQWIDTTANVTRSFCGAVPDTVPSGFSGQPAGRVWVAQTSTDPYLYYSDGGGQTRFIAGIDRGNINTPPGRIYVNDGLCTDLTELWWTTPSASVTQSFSVRSDGVRESELIYLHLAVVYNGANSSASFYCSSAPPRTNVTIAGVTLEEYLSDIGGCNSSCGGCTPATTAISLTINAGELGPVYQALNIGATALSYRLNTGSMTINGISAAPGGLSSPICISVDPTYISTNSICVTTGGGGPSNLRCGVPCDFNSDCSVASDNCTVCSGDGIAGGGYCQEPGQGGPSSPGCNQICDPINNPCDPYGSCPNCTGDETSYFCTGQNAS